MNLSPKNKHFALYVLWERYVESGSKRAIEVMEEISEGPIIETNCNGVGTFFYKKPNGHCCNYCGSMAPDDFAFHCRKVIAGEPGYSVSGADGKDKIYIKTPGVQNAHDGCIKFYENHIPVSPVDPTKRSKEFVDLVNEALSKGPGL